MLRVVDVEDYLVEPWKNGLGSTEIMAEERLPGPSAKGWSGLLWRLSRTVISAALPFSDHHGYDRFQVVTMGSGLYLDTADGSIELARSFSPVSYPGELGIVSRLQAGPVEVLNLMLDRRYVAGSMQAFGANESIVLRAGTHLVVAPEVDVAVSTSEGVSHLVAGSTLRIDVDRREKFSLNRGRVIISSVFYI